MDGPAIQDDPLFLSAAPAGRRAQRLAAITISLSTLVFLIAIPFAKVPLAQVWPFLPSYQSIFAINDLITAALLFGQFGISRSLGLLALASGYWFGALMAICHLLSFPGLFSASGLLGGNSQTTAWLYFLWHGGFPLFVVGYALLKDRRNSATAVVQRHAAVAISSSVVTVLILVVAFVFVAAIGEDALPILMDGSRDAPTKVLIAAATWMSSLLAFGLLWRRRPHSVLDLWLMVTIGAWIYDVALASVFNAGRFDVGWYVGRIYGLLETTFVLLILLYENSMLYVALVQARASDRLKAMELERLSTIDALTGIANRRAFDNGLDQEWRRTLRHGAPLSLLMIDVDCFKRYNDTYGHLAGDQCLAAVAAVLGEYSRRAGELAARYGGEEFAVLLPHIGEEEACALAERICQGVRDLNIPHANSVAAAHVSISVGIATTPVTSELREGGRTPSVESSAAKIAPPGPTALIQAADRALYAAKGAGRNQVLSCRKALVQPEPQRSAA